MGKQEELEKHDRAVKDGEIRLRTVKTNIEVLNREIETLSALEMQLEENVRCLKKKNIVAIAAEFKKAKADLTKTKVRLLALQNDREHFKKSIANLESVMEKSKEEIVKLKNGDNNVLRGKFGKKTNG